MGTLYYAVVGGSRILSIDSTSDHSGADDANVTNWDVDNDFIMAININSGGKDTESSTYKLLFKDVTDGSTYADVGNSGEITYNSTGSWAHGAAVATTDQVCDSQGGDTRQAGERIKGQSVSDAIDLPDEYQSELWFGLCPNGADAGHQYEFQLYSAAEGAVAGTLGALITIAAQGSTYTDTETDTEAITDTTKRYAGFTRLISD